MEGSSKSKQAETREFWEEAIRLWSASGLSVREFCAREGLTEHTFYSRRRELQPEIPAPKTSREPAGAKDNEEDADGRRRRRRKQATGGDPHRSRSERGSVPLEAATSFIELAAPASAGLCRCRLELENAAGAKMRIEFTSTAAPDLAAISRSFWNPAS